MQDGQHSDRVVAPVMARVMGKIVQVEDRPFAKILRIDRDLPVAAGADRRESREIDRCGHHEALGVIGMLADEVHPARCGIYGWTGAVALAMAFFDSGYIEHATLYTN